MSAPGMAGLGPGVTDLDSAERDFVASMDAIQEYMQLQFKLQEQLKQGLLNLARAKYSMGPIGQAQYDMDMAASVHVVPSCDEPATARTGGAACSGRYSFALEKAPAAAAAARPASARAGAVADAGATSVASAAGRLDIAAVAPVTADDPASRRQCAAAGNAASGASFEPAGDLNFSDDDDDDEVQDEKDEGLREANEFLRRLRMQPEGRDSGGAQGGKGVGQDGVSSSCAAQPHRRRPRGRRGGGSDPLHWFGVLVPQALKDAQGQFTAALETCVLIANLAQRATPPEGSSAAAAVSAMGDVAT